MAALTQSKNLILVGGPCVNTLTAQALGLPAGTCGNASTVPVNNAMIKIVNNAFTNGLTALVVAGWEAENTRAACSVLQQFSSYTAGLTGTGVEVDGTSSPTLKPLAQ
jgi:S-layer protein (TIGR01564 family)